MDYKRVQALRDAQWKAESVILECANLGLDMRDAGPRMLAKIKFAISKEIAEMPPPTKEEMELYKVKAVRAYAAYMRRNRLPFSANPAIVTVFGE
jgi:hypothetical protein